jgi:hypothetical protein
MARSDLSGWLAARKPASWLSSFFFWWRPRNSNPQPPFTPPQKYQRLPLYYFSARKRPNPVCSHAPGLNSPGINVFASIYIKVRFTAGGCSVGWTGDTTRPANSLRHSTHFAQNQYICWCLLSITTRVIYTWEKSVIECPAKAIKNIAKSQLCFSKREFSANLNMALNGAK